MDENQNPTLVEPTEPGTGSGGGGTATATAPPPPPPPPTYPVRPPLRRSRTDRLAAGVCGGIARQYGIDAVLLRILVVVATLFSGGVFLIAYVLAWAFIPDDPPLLPLAAAPGGQPYPAAYAAGGTGSYVDPATGQVYGTATPVAYAPAPRTEPRSYLGLLTLSAAVVVGALLALIDMLGAHISGLAILASMLLVLGIGLVVGAWRGRTRWIIVPALVLMLVVQGVAAVHGIASSTAGAGDRRWTPTTASTSYELGAGSARLDLTSLPAGPSTVHVQLGLGELIVLVPRDTSVTLHAKVGAGEVKVPGQQPEDGVGMSVVDKQVAARDVPEARNVTIDTQVGLGTVEVRYATS